MLKIKLNHSQNFSENQQKKLMQSITLLENVVNSQQFEFSVKNHRWLGMRQFANSNNLSNEQIFKKIVDGAEILSPVIDNEIDVDITLYSSFWSKVVGYTYPNTLRTWVNAKYFNRMSIAGIAGNIMHEWLHKLGFDHDFRSTPTRRYSVPYAIGYIVEKIENSKEI